MAGLLIFSILFTLNQMLSQGAEAQQCPAFGSEQSIYGWMLQRHIYKTMMADLGLNCLLVCRKDDRCQSFNFVMSLHMCEFSDRTKEARPEDFIPDPDRYYFRRDIKRVPLGSIPELAAASCKEIKASEEKDISAKYWLSTIKPNLAVLAYCDMKTEDVDECTASPPVCDINAICNNTIGSYNCGCKPGYSGNGETCQDIDECASGVHDCHSYASCSNTQGSFSCSCNHPFFGNGKNCRHSASECQSYTCLTSADRKITYVARRSYCDRNIGPEWYRFQGAAGSRMVSSCSPINRCNTVATGWLRGGHPTIADGQVSRTVCFHYSNDCCHWTTTIKVRNCGPFYVYYLSGTRHCYLRYCGTD